MFIELKERMTKEVKEGMTAMLHWKEKVIKQTEITKQNPMEILE